MNEQKVAEYIIDYFNTNEIFAKYDEFGNVFAKIEGNSPDKKPILLSAHMDVVGDASAVNIRISEDGKFIETDKKRPLGADDKVGVSAAMFLALHLQKHCQRNRT